MHDEVRELEIFVGVARTRSFTRAAEELYTSQPAVSRAIAQLEARLGVELFQRTTRSVTLTSSGSLLLPAAQEVINSIGRLRHRAKMVAEGQIGVVRLGVPPNVNFLAMADLMAAVARTSPGVAVVPSEQPSDLQVAMLRSGELDIGVLRHPFDEQGLAWVDLVSEPLMVYLAETHPLAHRPVLTLQDLSGERLVSYFSSQFVHHLLDACLAGGFVPSEVKGAAQLSTQLALIASGMYVGLFPHRSDGEQRGCVQRPLLGDPIVMRTAVAWIDENASDVARAVTAVIRTVVGTGSIRL